MDSVGVLHGQCGSSQPAVAKVLEYLHVQVSTISCRVVSSIFPLFGKTTTAIVCDWCMRMGGDTMP